MTRRTFLKSLLVVTSSLPFLTVTRQSMPEDTDAMEKEILLQTSPVAGFQFYDGEGIWSVLRPGDCLELIPEPGNPFDEHAVKVIWWDNQLGYLPKRENSVVFQMLQRGEPIMAKISHLQDSTNPWERITIEITLVRG